MMRKVVWLILGVWGVFFVGLIALLAYRENAEPPRPNLLLITLDTTRADRIGAYGYAKARTPALDQLAAEGVLFERAYTPAPLTLPAHASMMTGLYPPEHGLRTNGLGRLPNDRTTLAELLSDAGYDTGAFVASFVLDGKFGLEQGFHHYDDDMAGAVPTQDAVHRCRDGKLVVDSALTWLEQSRSKPFFCWVHLYDPHFPYDAHSEDFEHAFDDSPYDGEIAYTDALVGRLLDYLRQHPNTVVVVVGDHGESLGEHSELQHSYTLYNATQHVPLIVRGVEDATSGARLASPVSTVDVFPTMLELLDLTPPKEIRGRSVASALRGQPLDLRVCYGMTDDPFLQNGWSPLRSLTTDRYRYIRTAKPELYDLAADPTDLTNLAAEMPDLLQELEGQLVDLESSLLVSDASEVQLSSTDQQALEGLGYAGGGGSLYAAAPELNTLADVKDMLPFNVATQEAIDLIGDGKVAEAEALFARIVAESPPAHVTSRIYLGSLWEQKERWDDAEKLYRDVLTLQPHNVTALYHLGGLCAKRGRSAEALELYQTYLDQEPESAMPHYVIGMTYARMEQPESAVQYFEQALEVDPDFPGVQVALGKLYSNQGRVADAISMFESELALDPENIEARVNLGVQLASQDRLDEARKHFEEGVRTAPENIEARFNLGICLGRQGEYEAAVEQLQEVICLNPQTSGARTLLANIYIQLKRPDDAFAAYQEELARFPESLEARIGLAALLGERNQLDEAIEHLQHVVEKDARNLEARFHLGVCYRKKGEREKAVEHLQFVLRLSPGHPRATDELEKIETR